MHRSILWAVPPRSRNQILIAFHNCHASLSYESGNAWPGGTAAAPPGVLPRHAPFSALLNTLILHLRTF
eukprot:4660212-Pyramimonas_sp.AAC.1